MMIAAMSSNAINVNTKTESRDALLPQTESEVDSSRGQGHEPLNMSQNQSLLGQTEEQL